MKYEASYNGRLIDIDAKDSEEAMTKAIHRFEAIRRLVHVWPKRSKPVGPVTAKVA
jgi:hypothetical protein